MLLYSAQLQIVIYPTMVQNVGFIATGLKHALTLLGPSIFDYCGNMTENVFHKPFSPPIKCFVAGQSCLFVPVCWNMDFVASSLNKREILGNTVWYGLFMHSCDSNHEITRMQQGEIQ